MEPVRNTHTLLEISAAWLEKTYALWQRVFPLKEPSLNRGAKKMKKTIVRIILVAMLLLASGTTAVMADGSPTPMCFPSNSCSPMPK